ncbi:MAG: FtsX-like permease family protein [Fimbriimonadaceae bacterium]
MGSLDGEIQQQKVYRIDSRESILGVFNAILGGAGAVLAGIAALSLLVGGIGIMNIMLVSVTERTREIGLRKAVGARRGAVLFQFLVEAALLSMIGGLIGMSIAYGFGQLVTLITKQLKFMGDSGMPMVFPITAAIYSCLFSALIGIVFGMYPAMRASALSPIEALRTE